MSFKLTDKHLRTLQNPIFVVMAVAADDLALLGARAVADTVLTKLMF